MCSTKSNMSSAAVLIAVCFGLFMIQLDLTVVNVALSSIQEGLQVGVAGLQWVVDAYAILFSSLMLTSGDLGDLFGRRRLYVGGLLLFVLGSIACATASSYEILIGARALQGIGAAAALPNSLAILRRGFPDTRLRARAIGWWAGVSGLSLVAGPTLGGFLVGAFGWRSIFWINVPVGALAIWLTIRVVTESSHPQGRRMDVPGQVLATSTLASLIFAVIEGQHLGWENFLVRVACAWATVSGVAFWLVERRQARPMLDFRFFRQPTFAAANVASGLMNFGMFAMLFAFSLYLLRVLRLTPEAVGIHLLVMFMPFALSLPFGDRITGHFGSRYPAALGLGAGAAGLLLLSLVPARPDEVLMFGSLLLIGLGLAAATPALVAAAIGALPAERAGAASAVNNTSRQASGALGGRYWGAWSAPVSQYRFRALRWQSWEAVWRFCSALFSPGVLSIQPNQRLDNGWQRKSYMDSWGGTMRRVSMFTTCRLWHNQLFQRTVKGALLPFAEFAPWASGNRYAIA